MREWGEGGGYTQTKRSTETEATSRNARAMGKAREAAILMHVRQNKPKKKKKEGRRK